MNRKIPFLTLAGTETRVARFLGLGQKIPRRRRNLNDFFLHAICKANFPEDVGLRKDSTTFIIFSNAVVSVVFS